MTTRNGTTATKAREEYDHGGKARAWAAAERRVKNIVTTADWTVTGNQ
jgi:hypothetical protein